MAFSWETENKSTNKSKGNTASAGFSWEKTTAADDKEEKSYIDTVQGRVDNYETRLKAAGVESPAPKENKSWLLKTLDIIDRPRNAIVNAIQDTKTGENGALQGLKEGWTGKEHAQVSDLIDPKMNKYARAGLGFVGDVLLDPTTYLTIGAGGVAKTALKEGTEALVESGAKAGVKALAEDAAKKKYLKFAGQEIADLTPLSNKLAESALGRATAPLRQGIADTLGPIFNTRYVMGKGGMADDEVKAIQGVVDNMTYLPQRIRGNQQIALDDVKKAWDGVTPEAAEEATKIIEAPAWNNLNKTAIKIYQKKQDDLVKNELKALRQEAGQGVIPGGLKMDNEGNVIGRFGRVSKNPQWYKDLYKETGKKPTVKRMSELAVKNLEEGYDTALGRAPADETFLKIASELKAGRKLPDEYLGLEKSIKEITSDPDNLANPEMQALVKEMQGRQQELLKAGPDMSQFTPEGIKAADIAKNLTKETAAKDAEAGVEFGLRDNYIKHLYKEDDTAQALWDKYKKSMSGGTMKPNTKASFQKERKFDTYKDFEEWAKKKGVNLTPIYDARTLTAVREMEGVYKRASTAMYDDLLKAGEYVAQNAASAPKGWVEVTGVKQLKGKAVHPEIARHLDRFNSSFNNDAGLRNLSNMLNSVQNVWKGLVTTSVPFHIRNEIGNIYNNFLAGVVNPRIYTMAAGVQKGTDGVFTLAGKEYTSKGIMDTFRKQGLEGFGQYHGETLKGITRQAEDAFGTTKMGLKNLNPVSQEFGLVKGSRYVGDKIETNSKLAHFIDRLAKGDSPEQAAASVRKYLFDYSDLTAAEQKAKAFIPFYTWTRKNLPLQLESLVTQPGKPNALNHLVQNMQNTSGMNEEDAPDWMKNEIVVPLWTKADGTQVYLSPNLPISNLSIFGGGDTLRSFAGMVSPMIKAPLIEMPMNKQLFTGAPIEKYEGATVNYGGYQVPARVGYLLNQLGSIPRNVAAIAQDYSGQNPPKSLLPAAPQASGVAYTLGGSLLRQVNPERTKATNLLDREQQLADYRKYIEEVKGVEVPDMAEIKKKTASTKKSKAAGFSWES